MAEDKNKTTQNDTGKASKTGEESSSQTKTRKRKRKRKRKATNSKKSSTTKKASTTKKQSSKKKTTTEKSSENSSKDQTGRETDSVRLFSLSGELSVQSLDVKLVDTANSRSASLVVDGTTAYNNAALQVDFNGEPVLVSLDAEQVELLLKLTGLVKYGSE